MKKLHSVPLTMIAAVTSMTATLHATTYLTDTFDTYSNGNLVGQGTWAQTGSSTANMIQVSGGRASLVNTGQDAYSPLASVQNIDDGASLYIGVTFNVSAAQAAGDYFLHFNPTTGDSTSFYGRVFVRSSGSGFQLGYLETSGSGGMTNFGVGELSLNTDYRLVVAYNKVAGTLNDTASLYVNPTDSSVEANNTAYLTDTWTSTSAEPTLIGGINLRQGTAASAPTLTIDNLVVATTFVEAVPEPATTGLVLAGAAILALRRRQS